MEAHQARACFSLTWTAQLGTTATSDNVDRIGRLVSAGGDGRICFWDVVSWSCAVACQISTDSLSDDRPGADPRMADPFRTFEWNS